MQAKRLLAYQVLTFHRLFWDPVYSATVAHGYVSCSGPTAPARAEVTKRDDAVNVKGSWCPECKADTCITDPEGLVCAAAWMLHKYHVRTPFVS
jgi:hypothetical protein